MIGDGLWCFLWQQTEKSQLDGYSISWCLFVSVGELKRSNKRTVNLTAYCSCTMRHVFSVIYKAKTVLSFLCNFLCDVIWNGHHCNHINLSSPVHGCSIPDWFWYAGAWRPPVLSWDTGRIGRYTGLSHFHVTVHLDGISRAALIWIYPVFTCDTLGN